MPSVKDRLELNVVLASTPHEKALPSWPWRLTTNSHHGPPNNREALASVFMDAARIQRPSALWRRFK